MWWMKAQVVGPRDLRVSQNSGCLLGVHIKRSIVGGGLYWGAPILGKYMKLPSRGLG